MPANDADEPTPRLPNVVALSLPEALSVLERAGIRSVVTRQTEPPEKRLPSSVIRVIAQRCEGERVVLIVAQEAYIQPYQRSEGIQNE
ncbi:MAG TPA: hypothetical protein EYP10_05700 [Armatimonadetes bacterium]|nr:hypothetical protein [Armatimonadota bacterium]